MNRDSSCMECGAGCMEHEKRPLCLFFPERKSGRGWNLCGRLAVTAPREVPWLWDTRRPSQLKGGSKSDKRNRHLRSTWYKVNIYCRPLRRDGKLVWARRTEPAAATCSLCCSAMDSAARRASLNVGSSMGCLALPCGLDLIGTPLNTPPPPAMRRWFCTCSVQGDV